MSSMSALPTSCKRRVLQHVSNFSFLILWFYTFHTRYVTRLERGSEISIHSNVIGLHLMSWICWHADEKQIVHSNITHHSSSRYFQYPYTKLWTSNELFIFLKFHKHFYQEFLKRRLFLRVQAHQKVFPKDPQPHQPSPYFETQR